jgi:hypothetical protein
MKSFHPLKTKQKKGDERKNMLQVYICLGKISRPAKQKAG